MNRLKLYTTIFQKFKEPSRISIIVKNKKNKKNIDINDIDYSKNFWLQFKKK